MCNACYEKRLHQHSVLAERCISIEVHSVSCMIEWYLHVHAHNSGFTFACTSLNHKHVSKMHDLRVTLQLPVAKLFAKLWIFFWSSSCCCFCLVLKFALNAESAENSIFFRLDLSQYLVLIFASTYPAYKMHNTKRARAENVIFLSHKNRFQYLRCCLFCPGLHWNWFFSFRTHDMTKTLPNKYLWKK